MHKWLLAVYKQKFIHPLPKLQGGVVIGGVAVETEFVDCYKYSVVDLQIIMCIRRHVTLVYPLYPPLFAFQLETVSKWRACWPYWCELGGGGEYCFIYFGKPFMNVRVQQEPVQQIGHYNWRANTSCTEIKILTGKYDIRKKYLFWCPMQPPSVCRFK